MGGSGSRKGKSVKVVLIETQYVETDAMSFKSVVQTLTGKDSVPLAAQHPPHSAAGVSLSRGKSFKDIERMIMELPPLDELHRLYCPDRY